MRLLVNGWDGATHSGNGEYLYELGQFKTSEGRSFIMDYAGDIITRESDYGFIGHIRFQRMIP